MSKTLLIPERIKKPNASISTVERDTGLSKDTLRVWERRYGFPRPVRDSNGERVYPADQLEKLRVIRRLMDGGLRPGKVVAESLRELNARARELPSSTSRPQQHAATVNEALRLIQQHQVAELRDCLSNALLRLGMPRFVLEVVAPLNTLIGDAWIEGSIQIFEEHLYAEQIQHLLRQAIASVTRSEQGPRILLTTLPGEQHKIGLLMAEVCFAVEGANCIALGTQTPAADIVQAARAHHVDIVALSCSRAIPLARTREGLADLRKRMDRPIALWAGGSIWQGVRKPLPGVTTIASLESIPAMLSAWRELHAVS
jgi:MerR family transcriptional regulator, light-induced transcriptional regulator